MEYAAALLPEDSVCLVINTASQTYTVGTVCASYVPAAASFCSEVSSSFASSFTFFRKKHLHLISKSGCHDRKFARIPRSSWNADIPYTDGLTVGQISIFILSIRKWQKSEELSFSGAVKISHFIFRKRHQRIRRCVLRADDRMLIPFVKVSATSGRKQILRDERWLFAEQTTPGVGQSGIRAHSTFHVFQLCATITVL